MLSYALMLEEGKRGARLPVGSMMPCTVFRRSSEAVLACVRLLPVVFEHRRPLSACSGVQCCGRACWHQCCLMIECLCSLLMEHLPVYLHNVLVQNVEPLGQRRPLSA